MTTDDLMTRLEARLTDFRHGTQNQLTKAMGEAYTLARLIENDPAFEEGVRKAAALITAYFNEVIARITVLSDGGAE